MTELEKFKEQVEKLLEETIEKENKKKTERGKIVEFTSNPPDYGRQTFECTRKNEVVCLKEDSISC